MAEQEKTLYLTAKAGDDSTPGHHDETGGISEVPTRIHKKLEYFVASLCLSTLFACLMFSFRIGAITTLEMEFGLSSSESGFIHSASDIGAMVVAIFLSHYARNMHRPRIIALMSVLGGVASFLMIIPHFTDGSVIRAPAALAPGNGTLVSTQMCSSSSINVYTNHSTSGAIKCGESEHRGRKLSKGSYVLLVISVILQGCSMIPPFTLGLAHIDDNCVDKGKSALYAGTV